MSKVPLSLDVASAATISDFENQMQLSINPCLQTGGPITRPDCLFSNLFPGVLDNTSTFSPSTTMVRTSSAPSHVRTETRGKAESFYSHAADISFKTEGAMAASTDLGTDAVTKATDSRATDTEKGEEIDGAKNRKKRSRSKEQLDQNRIAQQKYRDRKRVEQSEVQDALDQMRQQLASYKILEQRMKDMDATNQGLQQVVIQQMQRIKQLEMQVEAQAATMSSQLADLKEAVAIATRQDAMINEHQSKLQLQEQVISQLKERLKTSGSGLAPGDGSVPVKILSAIQGAVYSLHNSASGNALQRMSADDLVVAISQHIFATCREVGPKNEMMPSEGMMMPRQDFSAEFLSERRH